MTAGKCENEDCGKIGTLEMRNKVWICLDCCDKYDYYLEYNLVMSEEQLEGYK